MYSPDCNQEWFLFSFPLPVMSCYLLFNYVGATSRSAHGNCSRCGLFHPLGTSPAISGPWWVNTGMTEHELHDYRQLKGCWLHILHMIIIPTINHAPLAVELKIMGLVEMGISLEIKAKLLISAFVNVPFFFFYSTNNCDAFMLFPCIWGFSAGIGVVSHSKTKLLIWKLSPCKLLVCVCPSGDNDILLLIIIWLARRAVVNLIKMPTQSLRIFSYWVASSILHSKDLHAFLTQWGNEYDYFRCHPQG